MRQLNLKNSATANVQSFESEHMPPPICQSSTINQQRSCEEDPLIRVQNSRPNVTDSSSLIPNSQNSVNISDVNVVHGRRNRKKRQN